MGTGFGNNQYTSPIPWYVKRNFGGLVTKTPMDRRFKPPPFLLFTALETRIQWRHVSPTLLFSLMADQQSEETNHLFSNFPI